MKIGDDYQNEKDDGQKVWHAERIGAGGFGTVLKVTKRNNKSKEIEITRAIKVIPNSTVGLSEAINASTMKHHPNVVKVYNVMLIRHICCIEMEYIECGSLADLIKKGVIVDNDRFRDMLFQCCEVLALMKQNGMVHSDIKPDNIMIRNYQDFDIAIGDFGLTLQNGTINKQVKGGTRHYWAPELKKKFKPTFHSDIYALGITFAKLGFSSENTEERERAFYEFVYNNDYKKKDLSIWENDDKYVLKWKTVHDLDGLIEFSLGSKLRTNKKFIMDNNLYDYVDLECTTLRKDKEFMLEAIKYSERACIYLDESFKNDREIVLEVVKKNSSALRYADVSLLKDREIVLEAVKQDSNVLRYADVSLRKDREIILETVKQDGYALAYADESLRKDREIVLEVVKKNSSALRYADVSLLKDREIVLEAVKQDGYALAFADVSLRKDREIVLEAVKHDGYALAYADESLRKDREIVLEAVKKNSSALRYADVSLRKDREIVLETVKQDGVLEYADESLLKDRGTALPFAEEIIYFAPNKTRN